MKLQALLLLAAGAAACAGAPPADDAFRTPRPSSSSRAEDDPLGAAARRDLAELEKRIDRGDAPKVQFDSGSDQIALESHETLDQIAKILQRDSRVKLLIYAFTDDRGDEDENRELSERRAKSVKSYLAAQGVPPPSMRFRGFGADHPIADNTTEKGRAKNRRVEFRLTTREWSSVY
jgi:outer membrane protein OmpA-like peptidoglycan-associated protein